MGNQWANFTIDEFKCKCPCGSDNISFELVDRLQIIRELFGRPLRISSGVRCAAWNEVIGGSPGSSHVPDRDGDGRPGLAVDMNNSADRFRLIELAISEFLRIGISKDPGFIHLDIDGHPKAQKVLWLY